jgi:hypothetical protein
MMRKAWRPLVLLLLVLAAGLVACRPGPAHAVGEGGDEPEPARRLPPRLRDDPERYQELKRQWKEFTRLPAEKQARLRDFDEELNYEPPATRERLWAVLDRYASWLDRLDEADRRQVESAPTREKKLEVIKALREREWMAHLPRAQRERIEAAAPAERAALIEKLRRRERQRQAEWELALNRQAEVGPRALPGAPADFWPALRMYVEKSLRPTLTQAEREQLTRARLSSWPEYAQVLTALADKYPIKVPPGERVGAVNFRDLGLGDGPMRGRGGRPVPGPGAGRLAGLQGRWPDFALGVEERVREKKMSPPDKPLGPCKPDEFVKPVQQLINELRKDPAAAERLDKAQGKWPDYPFAVMDLAKQQHKPVPGTFLPGTKEFWDQAKAAPPD